MAINYPQRYDDDFLNTIKTVIDHVNVHGRTIQDLVAEGQLTDQQYAELIRVVSGNIRRGEASFDDIDINKGKLLPRHLSEEVLRMMTGDAPVNAVPADGSLTTKKYADNSVTIEKTAFTEDSKNIASGSYLEWGIVDYNGALHLQIERTHFHTRGKLIEVAPNTEYTASKQGEGNRFAIAGFSEYPSFSIEGLYTKPDEIIIDDLTKKSHTFTTGENTNYIYFYVDRDGREPEIQVEYGDEVTPYTFPNVIGKKYVEPVIKKTIKENLDTVTVIEDIENGYPARPDATSVIWIGPNEPSEVEPYDEWREAKGHTLFQDFTRSGETLEDWRLIWNKSSYFKIEDGGLKLSDENNDATTGNAATNTKINENLIDGEIYLFGYTPHPYYIQQLSILLRGGEGTAESYNGYSVGMYGDSFRIRKYRSDGNHEFLANIPHGLVINESNVHILARVEGSTIKAKIWKDGMEEPDWMVEVDDTEFSSGIFGINQFATTSPDIRFLKFGIGTNGMKAPRRQLIK